MRFGEGTVSIIQMASTPHTGSKTTIPDGEKPGKRTLSDVIIGPPRDVRDLDTVREGLYDPRSQIDLEPFALARPVGAPAS